MKQFFVLSLMLVALSFGFKSFAQEPALEEVSTELVQEQTQPQIIVLDSVEVPEVDPAKAIVELVTNWKTMSPVAIGSMIILILVQILKSSLFGQFFKHLEWKRLLITILGVIYGILYLVSTGTSWLSAAVIGLISAGGAVAIYEAVKPLLEKKKA